MQPVANKWFVSGALAALAAGWAGMLVAGPWMAAVSDVAGALLYAAGSLICHQRPERSFHVGHAQLPVCARCLGLYAGAALGLVAWTVMGRRARHAVSPAAAVVALAACGAPTAITVASAWLGLGDPANPWRAALAVPLGGAAGVVVGAVSTGHLK